jgi:Fe-S cluster biogenesis protein NfuA
MLGRPKRRVKLSGMHGIHPPSASVCYNLDGKVLAEATMEEKAKGPNENIDEGLTPEAIALLPKVQQAIDEIRPALQADGGDIELLGLTPDLRARVRLVGACVGCPSASITLSFGVENYLRERVPEIKGLKLEDSGDPFGFSHGGFNSEEF